VTRDEAKRFVRIFKKACPRVTLNRKETAVLSDLFVLSFVGGNSQIMRKNFAVATAVMLEAMEDSEDIAGAAAELAEYKCLNSGRN
jgi:hypothetical protein